jgi:hypothetical protein
MEQPVSGERSPSPVRLPEREKRAVDELLVRWAVSDLLAERHASEQETNGQR